MENFKGRRSLYGKANQGGAVRKNPQTQAGTLLEWNAPRQSYNNYGQGGYQNRNQSSTGLATAPRQEYKPGQKDLNAMNVDRTQE